MAETGFERNASFISKTWYKQTWQENSFYVHRENLTLAATGHTARVIASVVVLASGQKLERADPAAVVGVDRGGGHEGQAARLQVLELAWLGLPILLQLLQKAVFRLTCK